MYTVLKMVRSCAAYGCTNIYNKDSDIRFHKFPLDNTALCKVWVVALRREKFTPTKHSDLCCDHFCPTDYVSNSNADSNARLKPDAVPSIFNFPKRLITSKKERKPPTKRQPPVKKKIDQLSSQQQLDPDVESPKPPAKKQKKIPSPQKIKLRRKIKTLKQKLRRREKKIETLNDILRDLKNKNLLSEDIGKIIKQNFSGITKELISFELENKDCKARGRRYSDEVKKFALTLHFYSPRAYDFLRTTFSLPAPSFISNWTNSVK